VRLVVTSWNLQGSQQPALAEVAAHLRDRASDVVLLQEVQRRQARRLAEELAARSLAWGFKHWPGRTPAEGMAVLGLHQRVEGVRSMAVTRRWRQWSWRRRIVQFGLVGDQSPLRLANVHLSPHDTADLRQRELARTLARLEAELANDRPCVLAGDFNARPGSRLFEQLQDADFADAWVKAHPDRADEGLTNWRAGPRDGPPAQRLDYVWVSQGVEVVAVEVPQHGDADFARFPRLSDHLPFTVSLEIAPKRRK
jgi:endonuclease/exonuclease/phosphatase family metal-dependent hydrolase